MKKILVPVDGSELSEQALTVVAGMLDPEVKITLVRVNHTIALAGAEFEKNEAADYLDDLRDSFLKDHPEASVSTKRLQGGVAECIVDFAREEDMDLIVTTTHGAGGLGRWLMGSVAEKIVRHAPCPVLSIGKDTLEKTVKA
jgi:nucleotide-binding universal stress UspA family protein